jgi:hypothetical protein
LPQLVFSQNSIHPEERGEGKRGREGAHQWEVGLEDGEVMEGRLGCGVGPREEDTFRGGTVDCEFLLCERGGSCRDEVIVR